MERTTKTNGIHTFSECVCVDNPKMKLGQSSISFKCIPTEKESVGEIQEKSVGKKRCEEQSRDVNRQRNSQIQDKSL